MIFLEYTDEYGHAGMVDIVSIERVQGKGSAEKISSWIRTRTGHSFAVKESVEEIRERMRAAASVSGSH